MAHQINRNLLTGKDSFFSVKEQAWHGLRPNCRRLPNERTGDNLRRFRLRSKQAKTFYFRSTEQQRSNRPR